MAYTKDSTRFRHNTFGIGIFRGYSSPGIMLVDFAEYGVKKFAETSVGTGHLTQVEDIQRPQRPVIEHVPQPPALTSVFHNGWSTRQYDTSSTIIGDKNILEAIDCEDTVLFNESYVVLGEECHARVIRAAYSLTIIGDLSANEIQVNGILTVTGNVRAQKISCANNLICEGSVTADNIYVGGDLIADSVNCSELLCDGNAVIRTTINIDKYCRTEKTMVACEGIIGGGSFIALNAIANEYFEFDGDVTGHVVELETNVTLSDVLSCTSAPVDFSRISIEEVLAKVAERIRAEYDRISELDEEGLLQLTQKLSSSTFNELEDMKYLFEQLIRISYKDEVNDLGDYLIIEFAKKKLPTQLYLYETIEHVDRELRPKAASNLSELEFIPTSVDKIARSLRIIMELQGTLSQSADLLYDKVFSSVGLRFSTVKSIISKNAKSIISKNIGLMTDSRTCEKQPLNQTINQQTLHSRSYAASNEDSVDAVIASCDSVNEFLSKKLTVVARAFTMTDDEIIRLGSVGIRTVGGFLAVDSTFINNLYKKKPFLSYHLITVWKKMKTAINRIS